MSEIDKMARELLAYACFSTVEKMRFEQYGVVNQHRALSAIRAALLTAPPGWKLVPVQPTQEMLDAAQDAHMPFGDMHFAITSAIIAAPEPK